MRRRGVAGLVLALALPLVLVAAVGIAVSRSRTTSAVAPPASTAPTGPSPSTVETGPPEPAAATAATAATEPAPPTSVRKGSDAAPAPSTETTGRSAPAGRYAFPLKPASSATYGRTHHDYPAADVFAPCGTAVVAPASGTLTELRGTDPWSSANDTGATRGGLSFTLVGDDGVRYYGSHLQALSGSVTAGARVEAGHPIGTVGRSGNARGTPCHLHFGISPPCPGQEWRVRRGTVYPQPFLDSWRKGGAESPSAAIRRWAAAYPSACAAAAALPDASQS